MTQPITDIESPEQIAERLLPCRCGLDEFLIHAGSGKPDSDDRFGHPDHCAARHRPAIAAALRAKDEELAQIKLREESLQVSTATREEMIEAIAYNRNLAYRHGIQRQEAEAKLRAKDERIGELEKRLRASVPKTEHVDDIATMARRCNELMQAERERALEEAAIKCNQMALNSAKAYSNNAFLEDRVRRDAYDNAANVIRALAQKGGG